MRPGVLLVVGVAPLLLVACGATTHSVSQVVTGKVVPVSVLSRALSKTASAPSEHVAIADSSTFLGCGSTTHMTSDIDNVRHAARFDRGQEPVVVSGKTTYVKNGRRWVVEPGGQLMWRYFPLSSAAFGMFEPSLLKLLRVHRLVDLGREKIDGVATTHYQAWLAKDKALHEPIEVWTDHTGRIRQASFGTGGQLNVTVDLSHFGERLHITPPRNAVTAGGQNWTASGTIKGHVCK